MSIEQVKETLHLQVEQADERLLRMIHAMTEAYNMPTEVEVTEEGIMAILAPPWAKPMTQKELNAELEESLAQYHRGEYVTLKELQKGVSDGR